MITKHLYIDKYPISYASRLLILGTIHPNDFENFLLPFFYGNRNSLWNILSDAFPDELLRPVTLTGILGFLQMRRIAISDTIRICQRINPTALDKDLIPEELNLGIVEQIRHSAIERILCTSGFGANNAFKLFYEDILKLKITAQIRRERKVLLHSNIFGRPILLSALYSPSGSSNIALSKNTLYLKSIDKYKNSSRPVYDFKVDHYRDHFSN